MAGTNEKPDPPISAYQFKTNLFDIEKSSEEGKKRTFTGVAYSGEVIQSHYYWGDVIFDLDTIQMKTPLGALIDHDTGRRAGVVRNFTKDNQGGLKVSGDLLTNKNGQEVAQDSDEGYPWEMSVYIVPGSIEEVDRGEVVVNGKTLKGPITIFRNGVIREVSFCALGADDNTSAVAASHTPKQFNKQQEDTDVTELEQLKADNQKLTTERDNAVTELKQFKETKRTEDIAALETELKTQFSAEDKTAYTAMDDTTFAFATKQLRQFSVGGQGGQQTPSSTPAIQPNPALAHLFTHQANGGAQGQGGNGNQEHQFSAGAKAFAAQNKGN
ncbi:hypothetical protein F885_00328 [Acinetobacter higginsii]|uniref:hypothetical protein n=1 Tax=Acinetobacter higginsii TaxID=70347 RepID=UPI0002D08289|nr:hypothetical protein [Acinetobacter higginsii]ENX63586.1 hypothetical protein F885_00328 [Acinetobacter higginsii]